MALESPDRLHAKQGRSTARVRLRRGRGGPLSVYLKRHYRLPWPARLAALVDPGGPALARRSAEWAHLERARALGIAVPEVVAAGERIGPWGRLAELPDGRRAGRHAAAARGHPRARRRRSTRRPFAALKRALVAEMAEIAATLHARPRLPQGPVPLPLLPRHGRLDAGPAGGSP